MSDTNQATGNKEELGLAKAASFLLDECRMVLPGIQALFGFQLIAVFNSGFFDLLTPSERLLHLLALFLTATAIAFVMTPAAFHRQTGTEKVTEQFIRLATRSLLLGMLPLLVAICLDLYLIAKIIIDGPTAFLLTVGVGVLFVVLWFVLPRLNSKAAAARRGKSKPNRDQANSVSGKQVP